MNCCMQLDEILHTRVPRQPLVPFWISKSKVKVTWVFLIMLMMIIIQMTMFFCVHNAVAICRRYLALSKAWWSCYYYFRWSETTKVVVFFGLVNFRQLKIPNEFWWNFVEGEDMPQGRCDVILVFVLRDWFDGGNWSTVRKLRAVVEMIVWSCWLCTCWQLVTSVQSIRASIRHLCSELHRDISRLRQQVTVFAGSRSTQGWQTV